MRGLQAALMVVSALVAAAQAGFAQQQGRGVDPNIVHFYMARQEIQILDDAPAVNDMRTQPGAPGANKAASPNARQSLPHAGFMPYSQTIPSLKSSLPSTYNGVPQKAPPSLPGVAARTAKAGAYKGKKSGAKAVAGKPGAPKGLSVARTYAPYQGYGSRGAAPVPTSASAGAAAATNVHGALLNHTGTSMLHWSRTHSN